MRATQLLAVSRAAVLLIVAASAYAGDYHVIPFNVDPPITIRFVSQSGHVPATC